MKKSLLLVFTLLLVVGFISGCGSNTNEDKTIIDEQQINTETKETETYSIGDYIQAGDFKWKITEFTTTKTIGSNPYLTTNASGIYLIVDVEVKNTGDHAEYLTDSYLKLVDDQDREFSPDTSAAIYLSSNEALLFEIVNPGIVKKGKIVFDVPEDLNVVNVRISSNLVSSSFYNVKLVV